MTQLKNSAAIQKTELNSAEIDEAETRWFATKHSGDNYYGRIYKGRTFEFLPKDPPRLTLKDGRAYVDEGPLEIYPGRILHDANSNAVLADEGKSVLKYTDHSGNLGGYSDTYYTATWGGMKASITTNPFETKIDIDSDLSGDPIDRTELRQFLSFIGSALAAASFAGLNLTRPEYKDYLQGDARVPIDKPVNLDILLGHLPFEKAAGL